MPISSSQALKDYGVDLLTHLPLENPIFFAMAQGANLFPLGTDDSIRAERTRAKKVSSFLEVIGPGADSYLPILLKVMKESGVLNVVQLADKIAAATGMGGGSTNLTQASPQPMSGPGTSSANPGQPSPAEPTPPKKEKSLEELPVGALSIKKDDDDDDDDDGVIVEKLWSQKELKEKFGTKKAPVPLTCLTDDEKKEVLQKVVVLLLTVNKNEALATRNYLEAFDERGDIYEFTNRVVFGGGKVSHHAIYYIGKFGACPAAITTVPPGSEVRGGTVTAPMMAYETFCNIGAIIGVGVACGVKEKVKMCDILVSTQIVNYDQGRAQQGGIESRGTKLNASPYLRDLFNKDVTWPNDSIKQRLTGSKMGIPEIERGVILSGPYLIDDQTFQDMLVQGFACKAIGIEMEGAYLFATTQGTATNVIIVKAVCDFGDGNKHKMYQPTAALLAADFVHMILSDPQVPDMIKDNKVSPMPISPSQALKKYSVELLTHLPLENDGFFAMAQSAGLFPLGTDDSIKAEPTRAEKVISFLSFIASKADSYLKILLKVMKGDDAPGVVQLADEIAVATGMDGQRNPSVKMQTFSSRVKLFISYVREEATNAFVVKLKRDLEATGLQVFLDGHDIILPGDNIQHELAEGIDGIIIIYSERCPTSNWCQNELHMAQRLNIPIFPVRRISGPCQGNVDLALEGISYTNFNLDNEDEYQESLGLLIKEIEENCVKK